MDPFIQGKRQSEEVNGDTAERQPEQPVASLIGEVALADVSPPGEPERAEASEGESEMGMPVIALANKAAGIVTVDDFEAIYRHFLPFIQGYILRFVDNREQAYDLTQDTFVKVYRALAGGVPIQTGSLTTWIHRVAENTAIDALRRRRLITWLPLSLFNEDHGVGAGIPDKLDSASRQSLRDSTPAGRLTLNPPSYDSAQFEQRVVDRELINRVLANMAPKDVAALVLYEAQGYSVTEIARILHCSESAVKMRLVRARRRFQLLYTQKTSGD